MDDAYTNRLSDYLDDEDLGTTERAEIEAHLASCVACRGTLADLRAVAARARSLVDTRPATNLWPGIEERIGGRRIVPFSSRTPRRISFTIPQLVAAGLALMVLSGAMVWISKVGGPRTEFRPIAAADQALRPANFADEQYDAAIADLQKALDAGRDQLDPQTVRVLEENLLAIDRAIDQSRRALDEDPANLFLNTHLAAARNRKLAILRSATALVGKLEARS
jgi:tetratricopeptide (TPR) repeat protein